MSDSTKAWFHCNRYSAQEACEHCAGVIRHEPWCIAMDASVAYAYQIITQPEKLSVADALVLHALGVVWEESVEAAQ